MPKAKVEILTPALNDIDRIALQVVGSIPTIGSIGNLDPASACGVFAFLR